MTKKIIYWAARVLAILFIIFVSIFALDVFGEPNWPLALLMHLIPSIVLVILTIIAWKYEQIGGWLFIAAGFASLFFFHFESLIVFTPSVIIGVLFIMHKWQLK